MYSVKLKSDDFTAILKEFPSLLEIDFKTEEVKHGIQHDIPTRGPPVFAKARRLDSAKLKAAKQEFEKLLELSVVKRSNSQWASPLHVVSKADGSLRPCGDY